MERVSISLFRIRVRKQIRARVCATSEPVGKTDLLLVIIHTVKIGTLVYAQLEQAI
jgi:hypothetical protein